MDQRTLVRPHVALQARPLSIQGHVRARGQHSSVAHAGQLSLKGSQNFHSLKASVLHSRQQCVYLRHLFQHASRHGHEVVFSAV